MSKASRLNTPSLQRLIVRSLIVSILERSIMSTFAPLFLRSLLISLVGMLVVVGAAHAHSSRYAENDQIANRATNEALTETSSSLKKCIAQGAARSIVTLPNAKRTPIAEFGPCEEGEFDHVSGRGCCAVACHAAVAHLGPILFVGFQPISIVHLLSSLSLHGRAVGPGDRPPRSA